MCTTLLSTSDCYSLNFFFSYLLPVLWFFSLRCAIHYIHSITLFIAVSIASIVLYSILCRPPFFLPSHPISYPFPLTIIVPCSSLPFGTVVQFIPRFHENVRTRSEHVWFFLFFSFYFLFLLISASPPPSHFYIYIFSFTSLFSLRSSNLSLSLSLSFPLFFPLSLPLLHCYTNTNS